MNILCIIPALPEDLDKYNDQALKSVAAQTVPVQTTIVVTKRISARTTGAKVSAALNYGLNSILDNHYDWLLRVDADTVLPPTFLEEHLKERCDLWGTSGSTMLINVSAFMEVMHGRFHPENDDSYTFYKFKQQGLIVKPLKTQPRSLRPPARHSGVIYYLHRGWKMYRFGYEPIHVLFSMRWDRWNVFSIFSYLAALITRPDCFDVVDYVRYHQLHRNYGGR